MLRYTVYIMLVASCACQPPGFDNTIIDIVGGTTANIEEFPFTVSLQLVKEDSPNFPLCGGSIISPDWVVTAAHCLRTRIPSQMVIRAGSNRTDSGGQLYEIENWTVHPNFTSRPNDIALIKVATPFNYSSTVGPVTLPEYNDEVAPGTYGTVDGWGSTNPSVNTRSDTLQKVELPIISNEACRIVYSEDTITDGMLCAGFIEGGKDSCEGDSGGPLVVPETKLVGIVSWGTGCAQAGYYGVYTRVTYYREWIESIVGV